jgi:uncharacterized protein YdeI (YjbR/CyaY-like superfamily)
MDLGKTLYVTNRKDWRSWLSKNHAKEKVIWLIYYKKASGKKRIPYNDAVEEALCFGWIDSTVKPIDKDSFAQRFTPRRRDSVLSQANRERVREMIAKKKMTKAGLDAIAHAFNPDKDDPDNFRIAPDILRALKKDKEAWEKFQNLPKRYQRTRIGYIESRRRHGKEQFEKSLANLVKMTAKNRKFGMVI